MLTPSLNTVMTRLLIVAAVLATLIIIIAPRISSAQEASMVVDYAENGTDAVITFTSTDPEGSGIDWDVTGPDADDFVIDERGVLMFNKSPNSESPTDRARDLNDDGDSCDYYYTGTDGSEAEESLTADDDGVCAAVNADNYATVTRSERAGDNRYEITVRATEQETEGADVRALSTETLVTVMVTDVNEDGTVTLDLLQPEVGTPITASLNDPDGMVGPNAAGDASVPRWQWYVSKVTNPIADQDDHWIAATGSGDPGVSNADIYTPAGDRVADGVANDAVNDAGKYLLVIATYDDRFGEERKARAKSANPVRAEVTSDRDGVENPENGSPGFSSAGDYTRTVSEDIAVGMPVGDPVVAIDPNDDTLTYDLDVDLLDPGETVDGTANLEPTAADDGDIEFFSIDMASGQLSVKKALDYDANMDGYTIYVRATDPSGETAHVEVTVNTTAANDAPTIMGSVATGSTDPTPAATSELRVMEQNADGDYTGGPDMLLLGLAGSGLGKPNIYTAPDEDARGQIFWTLTGTDADDFDLSQSSDTPNPTGPTGLSGPDEPIALRFKSAPDYENPTDSNMDGVYKVTLVATDSLGASDSRDVTVFVEQVPEQGEATLDEDQPLTGQPLTAMVEDPDNGVAIVTWQWLRATSTANMFEVIPGATTDTYTPDKEDNGYYLQAKATYTDITSNVDAAGSKLIDERTQKGTDAAQESRVADLGDGTAGADTPDVDTDDSDRLYRVVVTSKNAVRVGPTPPGETDDLLFAMSSYDRMVAENTEVGTIVGDPVRVDEDGSFEYSLDATITGADDYFSIDNYGQIRVKEVAFADPIPARFDPNCDDDANTTDVPDCPAMDDPVLDFEGTNTFDLIVTAIDTVDRSRTATAAVTVSLDNLNERPYFDRTSRDLVGGTYPIEYMEQRTNRVVPLAAIEPDGGTLHWEVTGADADDFMMVDVGDINDGKDRWELHFKSQPDFENLKGSATTTTDEEGNAIDAAAQVPGDTYEVTVRATEMTAIGGGPAQAGELDVSVRVTNFNEKGSVSFTLLQPEEGTEVTAIPSDPDGAVVSPAYQWYRAKVSIPNANPDLANLSGEWEILTDTDATDDADYTPVADDKDKFLLVRVVYTDPAGAATTTAITAYATRGDVSNADNNSPDFNASETDREIPEDTAVGMPVGDPVDVDRNEDDDVLTYEIVEIKTTDPTDDPNYVAVTETAPGNPNNSSVVRQDHPFFSIDQATGQLRVKKPLSAEMTDLRNYTEPDSPDPAVEVAKAGEYKVVVRATDPSGEPNNENRDDIVVTITATNVNEAPTVMGMAELAVNEADSSDGDSYFGLEYRLDSSNSSLYLQADGTFSVATTTRATTTDNLFHRSEQDVVDRAIWPEPIEGDDGALFEYSTPEDGIGRRLHFKSAPDFETPLDLNRDNVYEVTIRVSDTHGAIGEKDVRITVHNVDEMGTLTLSPDQPDDGMPVIATLTDPDGVVVVTDWKWYATSSRDRDDAMVVGGATMSEYTGEVGDFLWAMVSYRDGASVENDYVTALDERNDNPVTLAATEQHKFQNRAADGTPDTNDSLFHNSDNTLEDGTTNAVQTDPDPATDPEGPDTELVLLERMVFENVPSTGYVGDPLPTPGARDTIGGPDGATFVFAETEDGAATAGADAAGAFYDTELLDAAGTDDDKDGQLALVPVTHLDYETKDTYIIEVSDPDSETDISTYRVTILVMDVNEAPTAPSELRGPPPTLNTEPMFLDANGDVATSTTRSVPENTAAGTAIGGPVAAIDSDRGDQETVVYTLGGADMASFAIDSATGQLSTSAPLDFETKSEFMVTVTATDDDEANSMIYVTIMVTDEGLDTPYDMNEDGTIDSDEAVSAVADYFAGDIDAATVTAVVTLYFAGL